MQFCIDKLQSCAYIVGKLLREFENVEMVQLSITHQQIAVNGKLLPNEAKPLDANENRGILNEGPWGLEILLSPRKLLTCKKC